MILGAMERMRNTLSDISFTLRRHILLMLVGITFMGVLVYLIVGWRRSRRRQ